MTIKQDTFCTGEEGETNLNLHETLILLFKNTTLSLTRLQVFVCELYACACVCAPGVDVLATDLLSGELRGGGQRIVGCFGSCFRGLLASLTSVAAHLPVPSLPVCLKAQTPHGPGRKKHTLTC